MEEVQIQQGPLGVGVALLAATLGLTSFVAATVADPGSPSSSCTDRERTPVLFMHRQREDTCPFHAPTEDTCPFDVLTERGPPILFMH